jgi:hypothetical protein
MALGFEEAAQCDGEVVVSKEQSTVIEKIQSTLEQEDPNVKHGLCMGYSSQWIIQGAQGKDFWQYVDSDTARADLLVMARREGNLRTMAQEGLFQQMPADLKAKILSDQENWSEQHILRSGVLEKTEPRFEQEGFSDKIFELCEKLTSGEGFKLLSMRGTRKGSHAVAVSVSKGAVTYMDPNAGEVKFADKDAFSFWFATKHAPAYNFASFTGFYIDSYRCPVRASEVAKQPSSWSRGTLPTGTRNFARAAASDPMSGASTGAAAAAAAASSTDSSRK